MNNNPDQIPPDDMPRPEESKPAPQTELYAAYVPFTDEDGKDMRKYMTDGDGHLRLWKSEQAARDWIEPRCNPEFYKTVMVHPIETKLALPPELQPRPNLLNNIQQPTHLNPLMTFDNLGVPNALELLHNYERRMKTDGKNKGSDQR